ncbi:unnamed protein product, partial [Echinostoma caproni]|uniref:RGS domain-containing protein n=1 Tax=Echinostoma caproni TaxID=27848 RepID=A0A183ALR8_9TREM
MVCERWHGQVATTISSSSNRVIIIIVIIIIIIIIITTYILIRTTVTFSNGNISTRIWLPSSILYASGRKVFREFLRSEYSEENIMFWLACEELKQETNPELVEEKARLIYEDFISILSPREVSIS